MYVNTNFLLLGLSLHMWHISFSADLLHENFHVTLFCTQRDKICAGMRKRMLADYLVDLRLHVNSSFKLSSLSAI